MSSPPEMKVLLDELQREQDDFMKIMESQQKAILRMQETCCKLQEMSVTGLTGLLAGKPLRTSRPCADEEIDPDPPSLDASFLDAGGAGKTPSKVEEYTESEANGEPMSNEPSRSSDGSDALAKLKAYGSSSPSLPKRLLTVEALLTDDKTSADRVKVIKSFLDYLAGGLVLLNSLVMLAQFEVEGRAIGEDIGMQDGAPWPEISTVFMAIDILFVLIFFMEWCVRLALDKWKFCHDLANVFDTLLVWAGIVDVTIGLVLVDGGPTASRNLMLLRLMRALKSLRAIRMVRSLRFFRGLRVLVKACQCFLPSLCWSMVLLGIFMSMGALVLGNMLHSFVSDSDMIYEDRVWIWERYGTAYRAMYTLFEITMAGNWPVSARPVLNKVSHVYVIFFVLYITLVVFAIIRVISAVFLKDTLDAAQNDMQQQVVDKVLKKTEFMNKLEGIFRAIDENGTGIITEERLTKVLDIPKVAAYFQTMELDIHEGKALFQVLQNGNGEVTLEEFIDGIMRCKGPARAIDQVAMQADLRAMDAKIVQLLGHISAADVSHDLDSRYHRVEHLKVLRIHDST